MLVPRSGRRVRRSERQQRAVAELGELALDGVGLEHLFPAAAGALAEGLRVEHANVFELQEDGTAIVVRARFGSEDGTPDTVPRLRETSAAMRALRSRGPVIVEYPGGSGQGDVVESDRVACSVAVPIMDGSRQFGVLEAHSGRQLAFWQQDLPFVRSLANLLGEAVMRERMNASRSQLAAIVETSLDAIIGRTPEGTVTSWNAAAESLFGYRAEEMIGHSIMILAPPERVGELDVVNGQLIHGDTVKHFETVRVRKDGTRINVASTVSPIRDARGEIVAASSISRDISERKLAEVQLRRSEERYHDLFENASEPIATVDLEGNLTEVNAEFENALGYTRQELIGSNLDQYLSPESIEPSVIHRKRKLTGLETTSKYEQTFIGKSGRRVIFEVSTRLLNEDGNPVGVQGTCRDITARKEANAQLRQLADLNHHQATHDQLTGLPTGRTSNSSSNRP